MSRPQALDGVRVLDLTHGPAGGLATMILADFGAEVILIERPGGHPLDALPAAPLWRRGKHTLPLDLNDDGDRDRLQALCASADVLVCNWRPAALARKGLDFSTLRARHAHLVVCHISGFGSEGPRADYPGYEHLVTACIGRMRQFQGLVDRTGPVFAALQVATHACAQTAAASIMAALFERGDDGEGRLVETSLLQAMLAYEMGTLFGVQFPERFGELQFALQPVSETPAMPSLYYHPVQAGDGRWMQFGNLLPHLFENLLIATDLVDVLADPYFDAAQMLMTDPERHEAFRNRMLRRIQERPAADWIADFIDNGGIAATVYQKTREALSDPDIVANGHAIPRPDGGVQLGPVARLTRTPAEPGPDPVPDAAVADRWHADPRMVPTRTRSQGLPLAGVRVVELATIIAAPLGAAFLADMGADVIKVEPVGGDPFRGMALGMGAARVNAGKRSLAVNLKSDEGRRIVLDLLKDADVLIHNYRPGVPERLGIGYEQVAAINPGIVYVQSNGYGPDGPGAQRPSTHPIPGAAIGGAYYQMGERLPEGLQTIDGLRKWTARLMRANELNPDPNTAVVVTTASLLGLMARQRNGRGQRILVDMFGANAWANHDDFLCYPGKPDRALPDPGLHGLSATYRLYPCDAGQWLFLALISDEERQAFHDLVVQNGYDAPSLAQLSSGGEAAVQDLTTLFAWETAEFWERLLAGAGLGCVRADGPFPCDFWLQDEQAGELGLTAAAEHPVWGPYRRHGALVRFDGVNGPLGPAPLGGQHNAELLRMLGYDADRVAALEAEGVLWREAAE